MTPIDAEALVIVQGFARWLDPGRSVTTKAQRDRAEKLPREISAACRAFFEQDATGVPARLPGIDFEATRLVLMRPPEPGHLASKSEGLGDDAPEVIEVVGRCWRYLADAVPKRTRETPLGPIVAGVGKSEGLIFARQFGAVDRAMVIFDDLRSGTLSRAQARCFSACYPNVFDFAKRALWEQLRSHATIDDWTLARWRQRQLESFLDIAATPAALAAEYQAGFERPSNAPDAPAAAGGVAPSLPSPETATQRTEYR